MRLGIIYNITTNTHNNLDKYLSTNLLNLDPSLVRALGTTNLLSLDPSLVAKIIEIASKVSSPTPPKTYALIVEDAKDFSQSFPCEPINIKPIKRLSETFFSLEEEKSNRHSKVREIKYIPSNHPKLTEVKYK